MQTLLSFDLETFLMGPDSVVPDPVCMAAYLTPYPEWDRDECSQILTSAYCNEGEFDALSWLVADGEENQISLAANAKFDMNVLIKHNPELIPAVFNAYRQGRIQCVIVREKILDLAEHGSMSFRPLPSGQNQKIDYSLAGLELGYLGQNRKADKEGDSVRYKYGELHKVPIESWSEKAITYAMDDVYSLPLIYKAQEERRRKIHEETGTDPWGAHGDEAVLRHRCLLDFVLGHITSVGLAVDKERAQEMEAYYREACDLSNFPLLMEHGIVIPAKEPEPYKNGAKNPDGTPKMKKGQPEKTSKVRMQQYIADLAAKDPEIELKYSPKTKRNLLAEAAVDAFLETWEDPDEAKAAKKDKERYAELLEDAKDFEQPDPDTVDLTKAISYDADWLADYAALDPLLEEWQTRQSMQKMVTTDIPRMKWEGEFADRVHPEFDCLKETGRTSSYGGKLYPSLNGQNAHKKVRNCFVADPGYVLCSVDYEGMELGTLAQVCYDLYGFSRHRDLINQGVNIHSYLGAQLAYYLDKDFREVCEECGVKDPMDIADAFLELEKSEDTEPFYTHYRTFAKPTDLGYPGGLRERTFLAYAKTTYHVDLVEITGSREDALELARRLREIWLAMFPEMDLFFADLESDKWVDACHSNVEYEDKQTGEKKKAKAYAYVTPMGMRRSRTRYNATANGIVLQSPSAEGATMALIDVVEATINPECNSCLYETAKVCNFVHDEVIALLPYDKEQPDETRMLADEISQIMTTNMMKITPDVQSRAEPAIMHRWDKGAKPVYDDKGNLVPWDAQ